MKYDYKELREKAIAKNATKQDRLNLYNWFNLYGNQFWNGECYDVDGYEMFPIYNEIKDEDGDLIELEVIDVEIR